MKVSYIPAYTAKTFLEENTHKPHLIFQLLNKVSNCGNTLYKQISNATHQIKETVLATLCYMGNHKAILGGAVLCALYAGQIYDVYNEVNYGRGPDILKSKGLLQIEHKP